MAETEALHSYDSGLAHGIDGPTPPVSYTFLAEVINISGPSVEVSTTELTHLKSDDQFREWCIGFGDGGEITATLNYVQDSVVTLYSLLMQRFWFLVDFPTGATFECKGYITQIGNEIPEDDRITIDVTIKVTGKPIFTSAP